MTERILPVIMIFIAIGIFFGYINPAYTGKVAEHTAAIKSYDSALDAAKTYAEQEAQILTERSSIPADGLSRLEAFLPDGVDNVQLILDMNALAARSGLTLSDFETVDINREEDGNGDQLGQTSDQKVEQLELSLSAVGTYDAFKVFLQSAELSLRPLDLIELQISDSETGVYTYQMKFRIYWYAKQP